LITGASAGIGAATAHAFAKAGSDVILLARRLDRLQDLKKNIESQTGRKVYIFSLDVSDTKACSELFEKEKRLFFGVNVLVNNAGLARGTDPLQRGNPEDWDEMIDVNIKGLLQITRLCLPIFLKNQEGHIVNIGSVAGRWVYPGGAVYCATKHAVRALTEGLRQDVFGSPLRVTNIEPGMVETEFSLVRFKGDSEKAKKVYEGAQALSAEDMAETILWCVNRPPHVNIQEMVIFPTSQASIGMVHRQ